MVDESTIKIVKTFNKWAYKKQRICKVLWMTKCSILQKSAELYVEFCGHRLPVDLLIQNNEDRDLGEFIHYKTGIVEHYWAKWPLIITVFQYSDILKVTDFQISNLPNPRHPKLTGVIRIFKFLNIYSLKNKFTIHLKIAVISAFNRLYYKYLMIHQWSFTSDLFMINVY